MGQDDGADGAGSDDDGETKTPCSNLSLIEGHFDSAPSTAINKKENLSDSEQNARAAKRDLTPLSPLPDFTFNSRTKPSTDDGARSTEKTAEPKPNESKKRVPKK